MAGVYLSMPPGQMGMSPAPALMVPGGGMMVMPTAAFNDTLDTLVKTPGLYVKEKVKMLEVLTDYQTENTFNVSLWNPAVGPVDHPRAGKGADAFVIKEVSSCCQRQFCGPNRAFDIAMVPSSPLIATFHPGLENRETMFRHPDALVMRRPFTCTCCCYNRPRLYLSHNSLGRFATVSNPCTFCAFQFDIHAATGGDGGEGPVSSTVAGEGGAKWYTVHGSCCQPAVFCFCPWGECSRVRLQVYEAADVGRERPVGEVARVFPGCCKAEFTEADDFTLAFPGADHGLKRASLVSSVLLLNYLYYEGKRKRHNRGGGGGGGFASN